MLCPNCNQPVNEGVAFCGNCGTALPAEAPQSVQEAPVEAAVEAPVAQEAPVEAPVEQAQADSFDLSTGEEKPAKKPFKLKKPIIFGAIAVVLVVVLLLNMTSIVSFFMKTFASPEKYMSYVELNNLKDSSDSMLAAYDNYKKNLSTSVGAETEIKLNVGDNAIKLLETALSQSGAGSIDLDFLNEIALNGETNFKDNKMSVGITAKVSGKEVLEGRVFMDYENGVIYIGLPDLNDQYLRYEIPASDMQDMDIAMQDLEALYAAVEDALPSSKQIKKCLAKYAEAALGAIDDVSKGKETVTVDGMSQKLTTLTVEVTDEMLNDIGIAVLEEMIADKELKKIVTNFQASFSEYEYEMGLDEIDLYDSMIEGLTYALEDLEESKAEGYVSDEVIGKIVTYVNGKSEVVGHKIINVYNDEEEEIISYVKVKKGNKYNFELTTTEDAIRINGSGKETNSTLNGEFDIYVEGENLLKLTISDFKTKQFDKGNIKGTFRIEPGSGLYELLDMDSTASMLAMTDFAIELKLDITADSGDVTLNFITNDELFAGISVSSDKKKAQSVVLPQNSVDIDDADEWAQNIDFAKLIEDLEDAGFPNLITDALEQVLAYSNSSSNYFY